MTDDLFDRFIRGIRRALAILTTPAISVVEVAGIFIVAAIKPPWWINVPLIFAWLIWRNDRDSDRHAKR